MRRLVGYALGISAATGSLLGISPASATCMEHIDKAGVRWYSCAAPGGPVQSYICVNDICHPV